MKFQTHILSLFLLLPVHASGISNDVQRLFDRAENLKKETNIGHAQTGFQNLRQCISTAKVENRDANEKETNAIIKSIVNIETTAMLVNGAYDKPVSNTAYNFPPVINEKRLQIHYGIIFCIARTTHLLLQNPIYENEDLTFLLEKNIHHMLPSVWDAWGSLSQTDWKKLVSPHLKEWDKNFALTKVRLKERKEHQKTRSVFTLDLPEKVSYSGMSFNFEERVKKAHESKEISFTSSAFLKPKTYTFEGFEIRPYEVHSFFFLACQGPHGYFGCPEFGEQIIANIDFDKKLEEMVRKSFMDNPSKEGVNKFEEREMLNVIKENLELEKSLTKDVLKEIIRRETNKFYDTWFELFITYRDIIAYLNRINIYDFSRDDKNSVKLNLHKKNCTVQFERGLNVFMSGRPQTRNLRLIPRENTPENLFNFIKARADEVERIILEKKRVFPYQAY